MGRQQRRHGRRQGWQGIAALESVGVIVNVGWVAFFEDSCHFRSFPSFWGGCFGGVWDLGPARQVDVQELWYISSDKLARGEWRGESGWVVGGRM